MAGPLPPPNRKKRRRRRSIAGRQKGAGECRWGNGAFPQDRAKGKSTPRRQPQSSSGGNPPFRRGKGQGPFEKDRGRGRRKKKKNGEAPRAETKTKRFFMVIFLFFAFRHRRSQENKTRTIGIFFAAGKAPAPAQKTRPKGKAMRQGKACRILLKKGAAPQDRMRPATRAALLFPFLHPPVRIRPPSPPAQGRPLRFPPSRKVWGGRN